MPFAPGQIITRRYLRAGRVTWIQPMRVVGDDEAGLLLWDPVGSDIARLRDADGRDLHEVTLDGMRDPELTVSAWLDYDVLLLIPPRVAYSVWWFFRDGAFTGWYVNLEAPSVRRPDGVDTADHVLDIVVDAGRRWEWKDAGEFRERVGHPLYFDEDGAAAIRAAGEQVVALVEAGDFPFDGTHTGFRPDPQWRALRLDECGQNRT